MYNNILKLKKNESILNRLLNLKENDQLSPEEAEKIKTVFANIKDIDEKYIQKIINNRNPDIINALLFWGSKNPEKFKNINFDSIIGKHSSFPYDSKYLIYSNIFDILEQNKKTNDPKIFDNINEDFVKFLIIVHKYPKQHLSNLLDKDISKDLADTILGYGQLSDDHIDKMLNHHQDHVKRATIDYLINHNRLNNPEIQNKIKKIENSALLDKLLNIPNYIPSEKMLLDGLRHQSPEIQKQSINKIVQAKTKRPNEYPSSGLIDEIINTKSPQNIIHLLSAADSAVSTFANNLELDNDQQKKVLNVLENIPKDLIPNKAFGLAINWTPDNIVKLLKIFQNKKPLLINNFLHNYINRPYFSENDLSYIYDNIRNISHINKPKLYSILINHKNANYKLIKQIVDDIASDYNSQKINFKNYLVLRDNIYNKLPEYSYLLNKLPINIKNINDDDFVKLISKPEEKWDSEIINQIIDRIGGEKKQEDRDGLYYTFLISNSSQIPKESVDKILYSVHHSNLPKIVSLLSEAGKINSKHYQYINKFPFAKKMFIPFSISIHPAIERLKDLKAQIILSGGKINKRELPDKGASIPGQLFDGKGNLTEESIEKYIESLPKTEYNITWNRWDGAQRHRKVTQRVLQLNITEDQINQLKKENLYDDYKFFKDITYQIAHPIHKNTLGWARIDDSRPGHWHIDEIQSDFGQNIPKILNLKEKKGEITPEEKEKKLNSYKKIMKIICGPFKNINHAIFHAIHEAGRAKGINSLSMDDLSDQAKQSGMTLSVDMDVDQAYKSLSQSQPHHSGGSYKAAHHWAKQNGLIDEAGNISPKEDFINKWKQQHGHIGTVELPVPLPVHMQFTYGQLPKEHGYKTQEKEKIFPKKDYDEQYLQYKKLIKSIIILLNNIEKYNYTLWGSK